MRVAVDPLAGIPDLDGSAGSCHAHWPVSRDGHTAPHWKRMIPMFGVEVNPSLPSQGLLRRPVNRPDQRISLAIVTHRAH